MNEELSVLIDSVDIAEYIGQYTDLFEKDGELWGLSPLKEENTPSFSIRPEQNVFYDFSSGKGGNIIDFIKLYNKCSVGRAIQILKEYAGTTESSSSHRLPAVSVIKKYRKRTKEMKESTAKKIDADIMERFDVNWEKLSAWTKEGISPEILRRYNVRYDIFTDRIVYPVRDFDGNIINIQGRTLDPDFKEKGVRKYTYLYNMGTLNTLFGISENIGNIGEQGEVIIFEGAKSVMQAETWGFNNCAATLTSHLNPHQLRLLIMLGIRVVFALDSNVNIREDINIMKLTKYVRVDWVRNRNNILKDKESPADAGKEGWKILYEGRERLN